MLASRIHHMIAIAMIAVGLESAHALSPVEVDSLKALGDVGNYVLSPNSLKSPTERYLAECNKGVENYRIRTAWIFDDNNLDDLKKDFGALNQCYTGLGEENPSTGRLFLVREGREDASKN